MAAYVILDVEVHDPLRYEEYKAQSTEALAAYGGEFLVRGGPHEVLEGHWRPRRVVVLRFESPKRAREWYDSPEYEGPKALRQAVSDGNMILVEGA
jgi:uncharacterized protein (DUF1330 family)